MRLITICHEKSHDKYDQKIMTWPPKEAKATSLLELGDGQDYLVKIYSHKINAPFKLWE